MKINEIFYSLQGEGHFTGTPAIFLRVSGCNLKCSFCDTSHHAFVEMSPAQIIEEIKRYPAKHIVITGGEPSLQIDRDFVDALHQNGLFVQVETNGIEPIPENIDWITCSPKYKPICLHQVDELKCIYEGKQSEKKICSLYREIKASYYYLQPCDVKDAARNAEITKECINYIKNNPHWRLSLQTHKILNIQ